MDMFNIFAIQALASALLKLDEDADFDEIEEELMNQFDIDLEQFCNIASALVMFVEPISFDGQKYYCFGKEDENGDFSSLATIKGK